MGVAARLSIPHSATGSAKGAFNDRAPRLRERWQCVTPHKRRRFICKKDACSYFFDRWLMRFADGGTGNELALVPSTTTASGRRGSNSNNNNNNGFIGGADGRRDSLVQRIDGAGGSDKSGLATVNYGAKTGLGRRRGSGAGLGDVGGRGSLAAAVSTAHAERSVTALSIYSVPVVL